MRVSEEDRRVVTISLTDKGKKMVSEVNQHFEGFFVRIRAIITEEEFATALGIIKKVVLGLQNPGDNLTGSKDMRASQRD